MNFKFISVLLTIIVAIYLVWAIVKHYKDKSLTLEIIIEYVLTALLVFVILFGVTI